MFLPFPSLPFPSLPFPSLPFPSFFVLLFLNVSVFSVHFSICLFFCLSLSLFCHRWGLEQNEDLRAAQSQGLSFILVCPPRNHFRFVIRLIQELQP